MTRHIPSIIFAASIMLINPVGALSSDSNAGAATGAADKASKIKSALLPAEIALKDMRDELRRLHRASLDLISEVEQRDMVVVGQPLLIEPIPEKTDPHPGTMEEMIVLGKALPPRKKWLDITMSEIEKIVSLLAQEKAAIKTSSNQNVQASTSLQELDDLLADISKHNDNLKTLTAGPKYHNIAIGKEALGIYQDTHKIEKPWQELLHTIRSQSSN